MVLYPHHNTPIIVELLNSDGTTTYPIFQIQLPGIIQQIAVLGNLNISHDKRNLTVFEHYDKKIIQISLKLLDDHSQTKTSSLWQLAQLEQLFNRNEHNIPQIFRLIYDHFEARNLSPVLLTNLKSSEDNISDIIVVDLEFTELGALPRTIL